MERTSGETMKGSHSRFDITKSNISINSVGYLTFFSSIVEAHDEWCKGGLLAQKVNKN